MVHVLADISIKPESAAEVAKILQKLCEESRKEPGNKSYMLYQQSSHPGEFRTVEEWTDQAAMDGHMKTPHIQAAIAAAAPMFLAPPNIQVYSKLS
jgi:quinol monooxygenase YgiN